MKNPHPSAFEAIHGKQPWARLYGVVGFRHHIADDHTIREAQDPSIRPCERTYCGKPIRPHDLRSAPRHDDMLKATICPRCAREYRRLKAEKAYMEKANAR